MNPVRPLRVPLRPVATPIKATVPLPCDGFLAADIDDARLPCGCYLARSERSEFILSFCSLHARAGDLLAILERLLAWEILMGGFEARPWKDARRLVAAAGLSSKPPVASKRSASNARAFLRAAPRLGEGRGPQKEDRDER